MGGGGGRHSVRHVRVCIYIYSGGGGSQHEQDIYTRPYLMQGSVRLG